MTELKLVAPCLFGIESVLADEIRKLGFETLSVTDGRIVFKGGLDAPATANINLRCAERVQLLLAEFPALTFDELFEGVKAVDFAALIPSDGAFPVSGHSLKSKLSSVPDCQKIVKKAIVEKLKLSYRTDWFKETGAVYPISFIIMKDKVQLMLDLSGEGLHKRGYRQKANLAPLRETMAAAMVNLTRYKAGIPFWDPFAGSGTIVIEAAMIAANMAPGLKRSFISEQFGFLDPQGYKNARAAAAEKISKQPFMLAATDSDPAMKLLSERNAKLAGVEKHIKFGTMDVADLKTNVEGGIICCNPPYGERLLEREQAQQLYRVMGKVFTSLPNWKYFIISSDEEFEKCFGKKADKKRKLYNGMIKCDFYQYFK